MELQLVNFEQAKALKELGFPQSDGWNYQLGCEYLKEYGKGDDTYDFDAYLIDHKELVYAPTLELAAKWLRNEKHLSIIVEDFECAEEYNTYFAHIIDLDIKYFEDMISKDHKCWCKRRCGRWESENYKDYEEALSTGIDKAIEIEILKMNNGNERTGEED